MTTRTAKACGCTQEPVMGAKREKLCDHGNLFERSASASKHRPMQRKEPKRDWTDARAKVELEGRCRVCGWEGDCEAAHIMGRKYDEPAHSRTKTLYVNPLDILPLCGTVGDGAGSYRFGCHERFDAHELDLLPYLHPGEQTRAVELAGGIEAARKRLAPSAYRLELAA